MKMKMKMEKSLNMKIWPKVMEFCYQIVNFTYLPLNCTKFVCFFATTKKLSINVESLLFPRFSAKCHKSKIDKRNGHGKLRYGHGKVMEKYLVKSVRTLSMFR